MEFEGAIYGAARDTGVVCEEGNEGLDENIIQHKSNIKTNIIQLIKIG